MRLLCVAALLFLSPFTDVLADSAVYTYDSLGRIMQVVYSNGMTIVYTYDPAGNRTSVVVQGVP
ncbi:MAG: RHS repeat protein [Azoarcus sp.]|nr:RHS repeat protein [Azoarcus sp.]